MMRKIALFVALIAATVLFAGCMSFEKSTPAQLNGEKLSNSGTTIAHVRAENWGLYLFMIPLITGSSENPGTMAFLQDTVTVKDVVSHLTKEVKGKEIGATQALDMSSQTSVWGWMFHFRSVAVSANAVK